MNRADAASLGWLGLLGALAGAPPVVIAADYLSVEAAQKALFPAADHFTELVLSLDAAQRAQVQDLAGAQPPHRSLRAFRALQGGELLGYVFIDEVIGKEDFITYAAAIDASGKVASGRSRCSVTARATAERSAAMPGGASSPAVPEWPN